MRKLLVCAALAAACSSNALPTGSDGGGGVVDLAGGGDPCTGKTEADCKNSQACVADYCFACSCVDAYAGCRLASAPHVPCPALGCAQPFCGCEALTTPDQCQAAPPSMGCTAVFCPDCDGHLTNWAGCFGPNAGAPFCPPPSCPGRCRDQNDCISVEFCFAPGQQIGCGICIQPSMSCTSDGQCGPGQVCEVAPCTCDGRIPCGSCPPHFLCDPAGWGCTRQTCNTDFDCGVGFCVDGGCYDSLGFCSYPPV